MTKKYIPSRFNVKARGFDNEYLLANLYTGAFGVIPEDEIEKAEIVLKRTGIEVEEPTGIISDLIERGFLVEDHIDEFRRATYLHETGIHRTDSLFLTIMPTEQCNFRCIYCYESFKRESMLPDVREGLKRFVERKAKKIEDFFVDWFGGEPLTAFSVIEELSEAFLKICDKYDIIYGSSMTTNGYYLTPQVMKKCLDYKIRRFQITVDGNKDQHNKRRILREGGETFQTIFNNLKALHNSDMDFEIDLRTNFDLESLPYMESYIDFIKEQFGTDPRFSMRFRNVGKLGGPNDDNLPVCSDNGASQYKLTEMAIRKGLTSKDPEAILKPHSFVCYAAQNFSYVIGSDGTIYKCTVALDSDFNRVGILKEDGTMDLNTDLMALWTTSDETIDNGCQSCFFRPACQGASCPLIRITSGKAPCPSDKYHVKDAMRLTWMQYKRAQETSNL